jgi:hypothetical protein
MRMLTLKRQGRGAPQHIFAITRINALVTILIVLGNVPSDTGIQRAPVNPNSVLESSCRRLASVGTGAG